VGVEVVGVGDVDAQGQRRADVGVVGDRSQGRGHDLLGEVVAVPGVDAERQVRADVAERRRGVEGAAREVQDVAGLEHLVDEALALRLGAHGLATVGPGLVAQGRLVDGGVDAPALGAGDLQDEHVVHVVVVVEAARLRRRDVGVDLDGVAEVGDELLGERHDRGPGAVQGLQHERGAVGEQCREAGVVDLVGDAGTHAAAGREGAGGQGAAVLRDPQERGTQAVGGDEVVDRGLAEEVVEGAGQVGRAGEQRRPTPRVGGEADGVDDQPTQGRTTGGDVR
jgi:hypothetical protein